MQTLLQRLGELEKERDEIGEAIAKEKIKTPIFSQDHFRMALHNFRKIDLSKQDGKRKIIDTFINAIYVSDDDFKIVYNVNGKEETIKLEELESSTLFLNGAPKSGVKRSFGILTHFCIFLGKNRQFWTPLIFKGLFFYVQKTKKHPTHFSRLVGGNVLGGRI